MQVQSIRAAMVGLTDCMLYFTDCLARVQADQAERKQQSQQAEFDAAGEPSYALPGLPCRQLPPAQYARPPQCEALALLRPLL